MIYILIGIWIILFIIAIFPIKCDKCNINMEEKYYVPGISDSLYYQCPKCGLKDNTEG